MLVLKLLKVDGLNNYAIGYCFPCWEAATVVFYDVNYIIRVVMFFFGVCMFLSEGNDNAVLQVIEDFGIVPSDEFQQFVLELWGWHFLEDQRSLGEHCYGFE